jgi:hypothetical protein
MRRTGVGILRKWRSAARDVPTVRSRPVLAAGPFFCATNFWFLFKKWDQVCLTGLVNKPMFEVLINHEEALPTVSLGKNLAEKQLQKQAWELFA